MFEPVFLMSTLFLFHGNVAAHAAESEIKELYGTLQGSFTNNLQMQCELLNEIISQFNPWLCIIPLFTSINNIRNMNTYTGCTGYLNDKKTLLC